MAEAMAVDSPVSRSPESMIEAIDNCDEGTLRRLLQTVIRKVPDCRRKIAQDYGLAAELYQVSEEDRQKAIADQYSEVKTGMKDDSSSSDHLDFCERAKFVPMRLTYDERKYLRLIDATMHVSHYTDHMDTAASVNANNARKLASVSDGMSTYLWSNCGVTGSLTHPSHSCAFPRNGWSAAIKPRMSQDASSESDDAVEYEEDIYLDNESEMPSKAATSSDGLRRRTAAPAKPAMEARDDPSDGEEEEDDEIEDEETRKRRLQAGRTDILGMDGCALFCFIWLITTGVVFSLLYFSIWARDRHFFAPLQRTNVGKFFHGGVAAILDPRPARVHELVAVRS
ncbi:unnamed protein product [Symbiodinium necroappetens]|uniref:Non-canonical E2 ubiquitin-conjugating enzyme C-terminal domain-containing protein n=1 Tax=Symbiodinium necroappetens TaxID=1628268 RepID=A0A812RG08_9DINO|nr:unnamed protein product [Symbiodinium necroappetens]